VSSGRDLPGEYLDDDERESCARSAVEQGLRKSGDVKGAIRGDVRHLPTPIDVRRHRLISISYISLLPCQGRGRGFESRRRRHSFEWRAKDPESRSGSVQVPLAFPIRGFAVSPNPSNPKTRASLANGQYRRHLGRAVPLRDSQRQIVKWFGSCTDIEDQKRNQQSLEEEVSQRTQAVSSPNLLTEEMNPRERTRRELDQQTPKLLGELTDRYPVNALPAPMGDLLQSCTNMQEALSIVLGVAPKMFSNVRGAVNALRGRCGCEPPDKQRYVA
jgi:hypothetical protein